MKTPFGVQRTPPPHGRGGAEAGLTRCSEGAWGRSPHLEKVMLCVG